MSSIIQTQLRIDNMISNAPAHGSVPQRFSQVPTESELVSQAVQVVDEAHAPISVGNVIDDAMVIIENRSATETISVGADDDSTFVPWFSIPPGFPPAILPLAESLAAIHVKASADGTSALVTLYRIYTAPEPEPE